MTNLEQLIKSANELAQHLDTMAQNERIYGASLCHIIEQVSYDMYKSACELREIREYIGGLA